MNSAIKFGIKDSNSFGNTVYITKKTRLSAACLRFETGVDV